MLDPDLPGAAVFLDRDGTIIKHVHHLHRVEDVELLPGAAEAIRRLNNAGYVVVVVTNQSVVGRGYCTEADLAEIHARMAALLAESGAKVDALYYCPHLPEDGCLCRKPNPGMIQRAMADLHLTAERSFIVGDSWSDLEAGRRAGIRTVLVLTGYGERNHGQRRDQWPLQPDHVALDLGTAVDWILNVDPRGASGRQQPVIGQVSNGRSQVSVDR
ncbi:MAG TPA: HAD family hydrolase [Anaerolineae bacterium]|nr:HAD family hydrolase [Anaerolineae bacterium]